ncbi:MAG: hypothetical protein RR838_07300 [Clostridium sp.]
MLKKLSKLTSIFVLLLLLLLGVIAPINVNANTKWTILSSESGVPGNKVWNIDLTKEADSNIVGITVEKNNTSIPVTVSYSGKKATITTSSRYEGGSSYTIKIFLDSGKRFIKTFTVGMLDEITPDPGFKDHINGKIYRISPNPKKGYNYPYILYIPKEATNNKNSRLLVEPNNTGRVSDNMDIHEKEAIRLTQGSYGWQISRNLNVPYLIPVFPRPETNYVYTHELTRDAMMVKNSPMSRLDLQLVSMIKDAKELLKQRNITVPDKTFMIGYSASSKFTNRFAIMHPQYVRAVATGGINSIPTFPTNSIEGKSVRYPVGISDLKSITGIDFNMNEYKKVSQYIYMGETDTNDDTLFRDAYSQEDMELVHSLIGKQMLPQRYNKSQQIYSSLGIPAQFVTYKGIGHQIVNYTVEDVIKFLRANDTNNGFTKINPHS